MKTREGKLWGGDEKGFPRIYAVGDCNYSCVEEPGKKPNEWPIPPIPKISYPGEEMCIVACTNIEKTDRLLFQNKTVDCCGDPLKIANIHWPWGAGMFATSLGPDDACFRGRSPIGRRTPASCAFWGQVCAVQKEVIEAGQKTQVPQKHPFCSEESPCTAPTEDSADAQRVERATGGLKDGRVRLRLHRPLHLVLRAPHARAPLRWRAPDGATESPVQVATLSNCSAVGCVTSRQ